MGPTSMEVEGRERPHAALPEVPLPEGGLRRVIVWFRRDLRLADNPALVAALRMAPEVVSGPAGSCAAAPCPARPSAAGCLSCGGDMECAAEGAAGVT